MNKHISNFLLSLTIILGLTLGLSPTAYASEPVTEVKNFDEFDGDFWVVNALDPVASVTIGDATTEYASLADALAAWEGGSTLTILKDVVHTGNITVSSDATLTIPKGGTLTVMGTITIGDNCTLHITGGGTLTVIGVDGDNNGGKAIYLSGTLIVENATVVNAIGGKKTGDGSGMGGSGIYGTFANWYNATGSNVIVDGGIVNATGGDGGNWGTDAPALYYCNIIVKSGMLFATGADGSYNGAFSSTTVSSGIVYQSDNGANWIEVSGKPSARCVKVTVPEPISYMDWNDTEKKLVEKTGDDACKSYTVVTSSTTTWEDGWYVVKDNVTIDNQITINGNVNLILCDGAKLNVNVDGASASFSSDAAIDIHNNESANFTIYAQSTGEDMGELNVKAPYSALRGKRSNITFNGGKVMMEGHIAIDIEYSTLTVNGGDITFTGDAGIDSYESQMYVNGGNITVIGHYFGILDECQMYVNGGNVTVIGDYGAIDDYCIVKNSIPGTGWTNKEGTEGLTNIKVSTEGQTLSDFKKVQFPAAHTHNFTYSASGSTITATCDVENCSLTNNKVSLTIVAPEMTVSGTTKNANATLTGLEEFNSATELAVDAADIKYVNRDKGTETSTAPTSAGQYTAKITVEGQTASVDYEILAPVTLTVRSNKEDWGTVEVEGLGNEVVVEWGWNDMENSGEGSYTQDGVILACSKTNAHSGKNFTTEGNNTFNSTLGNFTKIEIYCDMFTSIINDGWTVEGGMGYKLTWTGDAESVTICGQLYGIHNINFFISESGASDGTYTVNPGTEVTIKATPAEGFHLASWSNGAEVNEDGTQKIKVTEDINIVANFTSPFAIAMDTDHKAEAANSEVQNGFEINTYGYCNDNSYRLKYYLLSGEPDQYKVEFDDNRFFDVDWTELATVGSEGTIDLEIPADIPTGDYSMKVTFRNSNYTTFDSEPIEVSFHVNLPETYTVPLYDNVIALVNTCECFTDIQWYHRDNSNADWQAISGATGYYYRQVGGLTGEYFVSTKMNGVSTYTCPQTDVKTLYGAPKKVAKVRVSPNPIENNATVSIEDTENLEHSLRIINVMGNVIEVRTFNGNSTSIDMGAYPTGSYMINVDGIGVKVIRK